MSEDDLTVEFLVDGKPVEVGNDVRVVAHFPAGSGVNSVQFVLTEEGFIGDAFNEDGENFRTQAFTFDEFGYVEPPEPTAEERNDRTLDEIDAALTKAKSSSGEDRQREGGEIYHKLRMLKDVEGTTLTAPQIDRFVKMTTRLLTDVFDMKREEIVAEDVMLRRLERDLHGK